MTQPGRFFLDLANAGPAAPSVGPRLTRSGLLLIGIALVTLAVGIAQAET